MWSIPIESVESCHFVSHKCNLLCKHYPTPTWNIFQHPPSPLSFPSFPPSAINSRDLFSLFNRPNKCRTLKMEEPVPIHNFRVPTLTFWTNKWNFFDKLSANNIKIYVGVNRDQKVGASCAGRRYLICRNSCGFDLSMAPGMREKFRMWTKWMRNAVQFRISFRSSLWH